MAVAFHFINLKKSPVAGFLTVLTNKYKYDSKYERGNKMREAVKKYIAEHYEDYVKDLEALTNIDSGNGDREGTEAANKFVAEK